jgi:RNA polymerase sigma factor (sigma-70 family)
METVIYKFCDGTASAVEVSDELGAAIARIERGTRNGDRRETRRHVPLGQAAGLADQRVDIEASVIQRGEIEELRAAMETLAPDQRDLIRRVFFEGKTLTAVADECGVSYQAVQNRLNKIFRQLRKDLT